MKNRGMELTTESIRGLKPYKRTAFNAHNTDDDIFRLGQIEGRNQVLYLLLAIGDENVAHDHWHPDVAHALFEARREIVKRLKHGHIWPNDWPDFEEYSYVPS